MNTPIYFKTLNGTISVIDLSKVKAISKNRTNRGYRISVSFDKESDAFYFSSREERDAILDRILHTLNALFIKYDEENKKTTCIRHRALLKNN